MSDRLTGGCGFSTMTGKLLVPAGRRAEKGWAARKVEGEAERLTFGASGDDFPATGNFCQLARKLIEIRDLRGLSPGRVKTHPRKVGKSNGISGLQEGF